MCAPSRRPDDRESALSGRWSSLLLAEDFSSLVAVGRAVRMMPDVIEHFRLCDLDDLPGVQTRNVVRLVAQDPGNLVALPRGDFDPHPFRAPRGLREGRLEENDLAGCQSLVEIGPQTGKRLSSLPARRFQRFTVCFQSRN